MPRPHDRTVREKQPVVWSKPRTWSAGIIVAGFVLIAAGGYVLGMYHTQLLSTVAPLFGFRVHTGTLDLSSVQQTYQYLKGNFDGELNESALIEGASRGLVAAAGDPYTQFFSRTESEQFDDSLSGNIGGGIGAEIGIRNDQPTVVRVLDNNPAKEAGVLAGDILLKVNDDDATQWTVNEAVTKIRGDVGTTVRLEVLRGEETKQFTITRAQVDNPSVYSSVDGSTGIMTITRFDDNTSSLARTAAQQFRRDGVTHVILDLRDNGGGYLEAAQQVAGLWLDNELVVTEKSRGLVTEQLRSGRSAPLSDMKTVVLVNQGSASASEIVAGALQDHKKATLIGETTFGKGSVQQLIGLSGGAQLKVTVAKWYTPNNRNINGEGITPDKVVPMSWDDVNAGRDPQLDAAKAFLAQ